MAKAVLKEDVAAIRKLASMGYDLNTPVEYIPIFLAQEPLYCPPLFIAIETGNEDVVDILHALGADPLARAFPSGITPIHAASASPRPGLLIALLPNASPDVKDFSGATPLHYATLSTCDFAMTAILLDQGADPLVADMFGRTPLDIILSDDDVRTFASVYRHFCATPGSEFPKELLDVVETYPAPKIRQYLASMAASATPQE